MTNAKQVFEALQKANDEKEKFEKECLILLMKKEEIAQLDAHLQGMLNSTGIEEYTFKGTKVFFSSEISAKVVDYDEIWGWMKENDKFDLLRADIIKKTEVTKLIDSGIIPKGIKISTYKKFKAKKNKGQIT